MKIRKLISALGKKLQRCPGLGHVLRSIAHKTFRPRHKQIIHAKFQVNILSNPAIWSYFEKAGDVWNLITLFSLHKPQVMSQYKRKNVSKLPMKYFNFKNRKSQICRLYRSLTKNVNGCVICPNNYLNRFPDPFILFNLN